jgi:hypothetical protein
MNEKCNLLDIGEEIFANLAEHGPQFWLNYPGLAGSAGYVADLVRSCAGCEDHGG